MSIYLGYKYIGGKVEVTMYNFIKCHLRNVALLLRAQRSSRHKNCRIDRPMFDNQHT